MTLDAQRTNRRVLANALKPTPRCPVNDTPLFLAKAFSKHLKPLVGNELDAPEAGMFERLSSRRLLMMSEQCPDAPDASLTISMP
jgi:hypothetical protein